VAEDAVTGSAPAQYELKLLDSAPAKVQHMSVMTSMGENLTTQHSWINMAQAGSIGMGGALDAWKNFSIPSLHWAGEIFAGTMGTSMHPDWEFRVSQFGAPMQQPMAASR
jgi:hypothetical protein